METVARRSDGSLFPVLFSLIAVSWKDRRHYLVTLIDISKRKKAEIALQNANRDLQQRVEERTAALKSAQQELIEASKMAALGRMSSAITHELNQPLPVCAPYFLATNCSLNAVKLSCSKPIPSWCIL